MVTDEEIRKLAYAIWEQQGRPFGNEVENYMQAKKILEEKEAGRLLELPFISPLVELEQAPLLKELETPRPVIQLGLPAKRSKKSPRSKRK
jgi:hypothetical protein